MKIYKDRIKEVGKFITDSTVLNVCIGDDTISLNDTAYESLTFFNTTLESALGGTEHMEMSKKDWRAMAEILESDFEISIEDDKIKAKNYRKDTITVDALHERLNHWQIEDIIDEIPMITLDATTLIKDYKELKLFLSKDEPRMTIQHIGMKFKDGIAKLMSVDGFRGAIYEYPIKNSKNIEKVDKTLVVHRKLFDRLEKMNDIEEISIYIGAEHDILVTNTNNIVIAKRIAGEYSQLEELYDGNGYIDMSGYINMEFDTKIIEKLSSMCKKINSRGQNDAIIIESEYNIIRIKNRDESFQIESEIENKNLENFKMIAFDPKYLLEILSIFKNTGAESQILNSINPIKLKYENKRALLMPVRLRQDN